MTSRERLLTAMRGGEPDRTPVAPFGFGRVDPDSDIGRELVARTDIIVEASCGPWDVLGTQATPSVEERGDETVITYHTPRGPLVRRDRRTARTHATVEHPLKTPEDVERFLSVPYVPHPVEASGYFQWQERIGEEGLVMTGLPNAVCIPASWFSPEDFCLMWADRPDLIRTLCEDASERILQRAEDLCGAGVRAFRIIGGEYVTVQLGPSAFDELVARFDVPLVETIHRYGGIAYYHNHGPVTRFLPRLAALGIDALDPLEAPPWGDVDLREARRLAGERLCFVGNLDDMEVLESLPLEESLAIARERLEAGGRKAFILGGTASGTYGENAARAFIAMAEMADSLAC
ncbi:MAG: uroporphyrinogen decarboxylase family protein [Armatimonadota bacterium]